MRNLANYTKGIPQRLNLYRKQKNKKSNTVNTQAYEWELTPELLSSFSGTWTAIPSLFLRSLNFASVYFLGYWRGNAFGRLEGWEEGKATEPDPIYSFNSFNPEPIWPSLQTLGKWMISDWTCPDITWATEPTPVPSFTVNYWTYWLMNSWSWPDSWTVKKGTSPISLFDSEVC